MPNQPKPLDLNLLPEQHRPDRVRALFLATILLVLALIIGLLPVTLAWQRVKRQSAAQQTTLEQALSQLQGQQSQQGDREALEQRIEETQKRLQLLQAETGFVQNWQRTHAPDIIAAVSATGASEILLTEINQTEEELTLTGQTASQAQVLEYARALQATSEFTDARIEMMNSTSPPGSPPVVQFIIKTTD